MNEEESAQLLRIGMVANEYMRQPIKPSEDDFQAWIEGLDEPMKSAFSEKGLEECRGVLSFRRFVLECSDNGMEEFMKANMTDADYQYWCSHK